VRVETFNGANNPTRRVSYEYDAATGALVGVNAPEGRIEYVHDVRGRLERLRTSTGIDTVYGYDERRRIESVADAGMGGAVHYDYNPLGQKTLVVRPGGTKTKYAYDPRAGWTTKIEHLDAADENQLTLGYRRDKTGIVERIEELWPDGSDPDDEPDELSWWYDYDGLKRLTQAAKRDGFAETDPVSAAYAYDYDRNGNRHSESTTAGAVSTATTYHYNLLDQLTSTTGSTAKSYAWDALGRMTGETTGTVAKAFDWSADDRLMSVSETGGAAAWTVAYSYDHRGERISRTETGANAGNGDGNHFSPRRGGLSQAGAFPRFRREASTPLHLPPTPDRSSLPSIRPETTNPAAPPLTNEPVTLGIDAWTIGEGLKSDLEPGRDLRILVCAAPLRIEDRPPARAVVQRIAANYYGIAGFVAGEGPGYWVLDAGFPVLVSGALPSIAAPASASPACSASSPTIRTCSGPWRTPTTRASCAAPGASTKSCARPRWPTASTGWRTPPSSAA